MQQAPCLAQHVFATPGLRIGAEVRPDWTPFIERRIEAANPHWKTAGGRTSAQGSWLARMSLLLWDRTEHFASEPLKNGRQISHGEPAMFKVATLLAAGLVIASAGVASAESASSKAPGHHAKGTHGASYYAPGHVKKRRALAASRLAIRNKSAPT